MVVAAVVVVVAAVVVVGYSVRRVLYIIITLTLPYGTNT